MSTMAAAVAVAQGQVRCEDVPVPDAAPDMVLVKTTLASICGSDLHAVYTDWLGEFPLPPGATGHEGVGEVVDGGGTEFAQGEVVLTVPKISDARAFAGYQLIEPRQLLRLPATKPLPHLLMAQQLGTVVFACRRLPPLAGKTAVVVGQGSAGLFHDFMLRRLGADRVIAIEPVPARLALGRRLGVDAAIDVTGAAATEAVLDLTAGKGADVVIDAAGSVETLNQSLHLAAHDGRIAAFGLPTTRDPVPFHWNTFFAKSLTMHTVHGSQEEDGLPDFQLALDLIVSGEIDMSPYVTHELDIASAQEAFDLAHGKQDGVLKVCLTF